MGKKIAEVDQYISDAPDFAQPMLKRIRTAFHKGCPKVEETIKWGIPTFEYQGILGNMAAFKKHVSFGFWRSKELADPAEILERRVASMSNAKYFELKELPKSEIIADYVRRAAQLNEQPRKTKKRVSRKPALTMPDCLKQALATNKEAQKFFNSLSPSKQRDYIEWIVDAKRETTRERRLATTIEWLSEGKSRNWKYENC